MMFDNLFQMLKRFDELPNKAENHQILQACVDYYSQNRQSLTGNEQVMFAYIVGERCYNQAYEMSFSKAYELSTYVPHFFNLAYTISSEALPSSDIRVQPYKKMVE